jgi:hypothetical protein
MTTSIQGAYATLDIDFRQGSSAAAQPGGCGVRVSS